MIGRYELKHKIGFYMIYLQDRLTLLHDVDPPGSVVILSTTLRTKYLLHFHDIAMSSLIIIPYFL